ncbi:hypothetical protein EYB53_001290 [Candidatus Chloroploca sp. M-50]|uniref:Uncharacterized protein n=1 Tax=Candidatus Chloroploca mongolica TaxID=2528176 RepID=A0ABS4D4H5_9CHLR|nr:hypothetical protein [Candidatus Chloroploca mongolica]MBP1464331.1 hypothetical protein [Candidatus Chloroploca mongolica]
MPRWLSIWRYGTLVMLLALLVVTVRGEANSVASRASFENLPLVWQRAALHSTEQRPSLLSTTPGQTAPPSQSARAPAGRGLNEQPFQVWIPVIAEAPGPSARVRFGAGRNGDELLEEGTSFSFGLTTLYYAVSITDSSEGRFREEWIINGQHQPTLDRSGLLPQPEGGNYLSGITLSTGAPLPIGAYELHIFVDERLAGIGRLQVLPSP